MPPVKAPAAEPNFNPRSLAGATKWLSPRSSSSDDFNPRSLAGATLLFRSSLSCQANFNPRSLAGATFCGENTQVLSSFQSTLPCGSDFKIFEPWHSVITFQSTLPCGSDLCPNGNQDIDRKISIHAPLRERQAITFPKSEIGIFQSTLPCGSDSIKRKYFSFHLNQAFIAN